VQELAADSAFFPELFVDCPVAVFDIPNDGMTYGSQMGSDLMGPSRYQFYFEIGYPFIRKERFVFRSDIFGIRSLFFQDPHLIGLFILYKISVDQLPALKPSVDDTPVVFMEATLLEYFGHGLQPCKGFPCDYDAARVPVKPVAYRRFKALQAVHCDFAFVKQIGNHMFNH